MANAPDDIEVDPNAAAFLFMDLDERTTEQVVKDIAAAEPHRHGVPVEERRRRALATARDTGWIDGLEAEDQLIVAAGGDPDEILPGNKARWTVSADGMVKDHLTGQEFGHVEIGPAESAGSDQQSGNGENAGEVTSDTRPAAVTVNDGSIPSGSAAYAFERAQCDHKFPEPLADDSKCPRCGLTFGEWANS